MKNILFLFAAALFLLSSFSSCSVEQKQSKEEEHQIKYNFQCIGRVSDFRPVSTNPKIKDFEITLDTGVRFTVGRFSSDDFCRTGTLVFQIEVINGFLAKDLYILDVSNGGVYPRPIMHSDSAPDVFLDAYEVTIKTNKVKSK